MAHDFEGAGAVGETDVVNTYRVFLGRPPESKAVIQDRLGLTRDQLIQAIVQSEEFSRHVVGAIFSGDIETSDRFQDPLEPDVNAWATAVFGVEDEAALSSNRSWSRVLLSALPFLRLQPWSSAIEQTLFTSGFKEALASWGQAERTSSLIGGIDVCDAGRLIGWALDRAHVETGLVVEVFANGRFVAAAKAVKFRRDLQATFGGDGFYGFSLDLRNQVDALDARAVKVEVVEARTRKLLAGASLTSQPQAPLDALASIALMLKEIKDSLGKIEQNIPAARALTSFSIESYNAYVEAFCLDLPRHQVVRRAARSEPDLIKTISIIIVVDDARLNTLDATLESLVDNDYAGTQVIVAYTDARHSTRALPWIDGFLARLGAPARQLWPETRRSRAEAAAEAVQASEGEVVCSLEAGDRLAASALHRLAKAFEARPQIRMVYSDEDQVERFAGGRLFYHSPKFNAEFDPLIVRQADLAGGLAAFAGDFIRGLEASGRLERDDGFIRMLELCDAAGEQGVVHIPHVLLHRFSPLAAPGPGQVERRRAYLQAHLEGRGEGGRVEVANDPLGATVPGCLRIAPTGLEAVTATVVIPSRDNVALLRPCIEGLIQTMGQNVVRFDILVVDNGSTNEDTLVYLSALQGRSRLRVRRDDSPFNWAALNNAAVAGCAADVLIFLNDDMLPIIGDWCDELCFWALRPKTGVVGTRLLYEDGSIQHAGVVGGAFGLAAHEGVGAAGSDPGYLGRHAMVRRAMAVTGACMAVRRAVFEQLGGFDAAAFAMTYNDVDFCLRAAEAGLDVIYTPYASFYHFESKSRGFDFQAPTIDQTERSKEAEAIRRRWGGRLLNDPTYNPHFDRWSRPFTRLAAVEPD